MKAGRPSDDAARRAYWIEQMDAAWGFMEKMMACRVAECGEPMVSLPQAAREAGVEVAFSPLRTSRGFKRIYRLRAGLIAAFVAAAREMNRRGWALRVEDGFRTRTIQKHLALRKRIFPVILKRVVWELNGAAPTPEQVFRRVSVLVATRPKTGTHMSGSAIDISVLHRDTGAEVDRGAPYLEMSERTPMESPYVPRQALRNRRAISDLMAAHGLMAFPYEFWHYSSGDACIACLKPSGKPVRYGAVDMDPRTGRVTPIPNPLQPLHSMAEIRAMIARAMRS